MSDRRATGIWGPRVAGLLLVGLYAVRAVYGLVGGVAYSAGRQAAALGDYPSAQRLLDQAVAGHDPATLHWLRGQVRQGLAKQLAEETARTDESDDMLRSAFDDYCRAIVVSPSSGWYWADLAEIYQDVELIESAEFPVSLELMDRGRWALVGRPGRVAIGLSRFAVAREPGSYILHDRLAEVLFDNGLVEPGLAAVRSSARVQPIFAMHPYRYMNPLPPEVLAAFAEASREALEATPLLRTSVHLTALGRVEVQRENWAQAVGDFTRALELPGHELDRAEASYWLGYALGQLDRTAEALAALEQAREHPNLETRALETMAELVERQGDLAAATRLRRELHQADRRNLTWILDYARVAYRAGAVSEAEDVLTWGLIVHPEEPRLHAELIGLYVESNDLTRARRHLAELERFPEVAELARLLRQRIERVAGGLDDARPES